MATHGAVGPFVQGHEDWVSYAECLQEYFAANDIDAAAKQHAILLSSCGAEAYQLICNLVVLHKPVDKGFKHLVDLVRTNYCPPPSVFAQRLPLTIRCNAREKQRLNSSQNSGNCRSNVSLGLPLMRCCAIDWCVESKICVESKMEDFSSVC